jgi:uroporphyrinogen decarboxylase
MLTPRERFLTAVRNGVPDRVPATPDISNMIPAKRTGLPFWDIYFRKTVPLWRAYLDAADYFGIEAWVASCWGYGGQFRPNPAVEVTHNVRPLPTQDAWVRQTRVRTPAGELTGEDICFRADPPTPTGKLIKDLAADFPKYKWLLQPPVAIDRQRWDVVRDECARRSQAFGVGMVYPGFHEWFNVVQGGVEALTYAYLDTPEILDEWCELQTAAGTKAMELILAERPDYVLFGGSGTITLASPELARRYALPALQRWSRMCREAGVATMLHSCGKSRVLVDLLVEETDVNCINPLEVPPMGDVDLAEVKRARGKQIALMGNLHTTAVMLRGSADHVREKAREAIRVAGPGGGFILSTGDQCGRDTPEENLFALVEIAQEFGVYDPRTGQLAGSS